MNVIWRRFSLGVVALSVLITGVACGARAAEMAAAADGEDVVLAEFEWNGTPHQITLSQLEKEISELPEYRKDDYEGREGREEYLTLMAESRMLLEYARDLGLDKDPEINRKVEDYRRSRMIDAIKEDEIDKKVSVTDEEVAAYYEENKDDYIIPEQIRLTIITLQDKELAEKTLQEILSGEATLEERAKGFSEQGLNVGPGGSTDGDTGFFGRNDFRDAEAFVEKAWSLEVGEMTKEVFEFERLGKKYYMIFRLEERNPPRQQTLEEVRSRVERTVERNKQREREAAWKEELRQIAKLTVYEDKIPEPPAPPEGEKPKQYTPDLTADTVLAEYTWLDTPYTFTFGELLDRFNRLSVYRQSQFNNRDEWVEYLNDEVMKNLEVLEAKELGFGYGEEDERILTEYRHQLMVEALVEQEVDAKVSYDESDLQAYYEENKDKYVEPEKVRLTAITFTDKDEAEEMLKEIKAGRDIVEAARTLSEMGKNLGPGVRNYGDTGLFDRKTYGHAEAFTEAAFSTPVGEITPEVIVQELQGDTYYMIFRVEEKKPPRQKTLDEVRPRVEDAVQKIKKRERLNEWLTSLKEKSKLRIYADRLPEYPEPETDAEDAG